MRNAVRNVLAKKRNPYRGTRLRPSHGVGVGTPLVADLNTLKSPRWSHGRRLRARAYAKSFCCCDVPLAHGVGRSDMGVFEISNSIR